MAMLLLYDIYQPLEINIWLNINCDLLDGSTLDLITVILRGHPLNLNSYRASL